MGWNTAVLTVCLGSATLGCMAATAPPQLYLMTESSPPISMLDGQQVVGSGTEKVADIMARTGTAYSMELLPWKRAYLELQRRPDACLFSTTRTPEREALFRWVGPTDEAEWVLLGRADRVYHLRTLEDARPLRIGTYNGDVRDSYLRARGFQVDPAPNDLLNPDKLLMDRIDLWAAGLKRGHAALQHFDWASKIVPVLTFNKVSVYLACNRGVPASLVARMNTAVKAMNRDGTMRRIDLKYEKWVDVQRPRP
ncbi:substrate-binding periplasmic protein [Massilia sp. DWR3-1-1]|uniref:substrate-binding periplasmic protein n=1 Tax=Massilia sp. DWR3-1-1 TaxID=2804559 RepID=UPI003CF9F66D